MKGNLTCVKRADSNTGDFFGGRFEPFLWLTTIQSGSKQWGSPEGPRAYRVACTMLAGKRKRERRTEGGREKEREERKKTVTEIYVRHQEP